MGFLGKLRHSKLKKAYENGAKIEMQLEKDVWMHWKNPTWDWSMKYRIKK